MFALRFVICGAVLFGASFGCKRSDTSEQLGNVAPDGTRIVPITANDDGFVPARIEVEKGSRVTLRFTRTSAETCADKVVFPELNLSKDLPLNTPVELSIPTDTARSLTFQCGMGMYKSAVVVR